MYTHTRIHACMYIGTQCIIYTHVYMHVHRDTMYIHTRIHACTSGHNEKVYTSQQKYSVFMYSSYNMMIVQKALMCIYLDIQS